MHTRYLTSLALIALLLSGCSGDPARSLHKSTRVMMGTLVEITLAGKADRAKATAHDLFNEIQRIEDLSSFHKPSEITKINDNAGKGPGKAPAEVLMLIGEALRVAQQTEGAFDPTIGPVSRLWQFSGEKEPRVPTETEIREALTKVGWDRVKIDEAAGTVLLPETGMALDLGGITKGYVLNRAAEIMRKSGIQGGLINIGGDILAMGEKEPGKPWRVGVEDPRNKSGIVAVTALRDRVIITSGDYERFFVQGEKRYHHILDPATGYPADKLRSVTVVGPIGVSLQPLGTATFVMGVARGLRLVESIETAQGFLIDAEGVYHFTDGAQGVFEIRPGS